MIDIKEVDHNHQKIINCIKDDLFPFNSLKQGDEVYLTKNPSDPNSVYDTLATNKDSQILFTISPIQKKVLEVDSSYFKAFNQVINRNKVAEKLVKNIDLAFAELRDQAHESLLDLEADYQEIEDDPDIYTKLSQSKKEKFDKYASELRPSFLKESIDLLKAFEAETYGNVSEELFMLDPYKSKDGLDNIQISYTLVSIPSVSEKAAINCSLDLNKLDFYQEITLFEFCKINRFNFATPYVLNRFLQSEDFIKKLQTIDRDDIETLKEKNSDKNKIQNNYEKN